MLASMMSAIRRHGRFLWIAGGIALALGVVYFLLWEPPSPESAASKKLPPEELVKLLKENTVRAERSEKRSTPHPRLDQAESP
jgi:hypothetical protein